MIDSNPISNGEVTSEYSFYLRMFNAIKDTSDLVPDKDFLENWSTISIQSEQPMHDCYDFDTYYYFACNLLEDKPEDDNIQSSKIVGILCDQSHRFNAPPPPPKNTLWTIIAIMKKCNTSICAWRTTYGMSSLICCIGTLSTRKTQHLPNCLHYLVSK